MVAVTIALLAASLPALAYWQAKHPDPIVAEQWKPPAVTAVTLGRLPPIPAYRGSIPVLTYHGVARAGGRYTVTPQEFNVQIAALGQAGFHTVTSQQFLDTMAGRAPTLPTKPIMITFDDGAKTVWANADPVLRAHNFRAVMFVITGRVATHQPYYLNWDEIAAMQHSGRWEFGSHSRDGHRFVPVAPDGTARPFLTDLMWLAARHRLETPAEYRGRVSEDLDSSIADLLRHRLPRPRLFADPFSASTGASNYPGLIDTVRRIEHDRFAALVNNTAPARFALPAQRSGYVHRIEVFHGTSPQGLLEAIVRAAYRTAGVVVGARAPGRVAPVPRRRRHAAPPASNPDLQPQAPGDLAPYLHLPPPSSTAAIVTPRVRAGRFPGPRVTERPAPRRRDRFQQPARALRPVARRRPTGGRPAPRPPSAAAPTPQTAPTPAAETAPPPADSAPPPDSPPVDPVAPSDGAPAPGEGSPPDPPPTDTHAGP